MKLVHIQQALFAAYDIRNAMTTDDMYRPTEGESVGECLAEIINTLENIEAETERHHKVITIGQFTVVYQWLPEVSFCGTAFGWEAFAPDEFYDSPEQKHLEKVSDSLRASYSNEEYMDELIAALASNPFDVEALPTPRMSPSMPAWRWCNYPEWCMTDTPTEGKREMITYDIKEGQLVRLFHGRPDMAWDIEQLTQEKKMNWDKTKAYWDGEDWVFTDVPIEAGWDSGTTCFSETELGDCNTPEQAIEALKYWVKAI